jgi:hypothetical protein
MIVKKAKKHNDEWTVNDCYYFISTCVEFYKRNEAVITEIIARKLERSYDAVICRRKEVLGILTNKEKGIHNITPNMVEALKQYRVNTGVSQTKLDIAFDVI